jgi:hypothetical protein
MMKEQSMSPRASAAARGVLAARGVVLGVFGLVLVGLLVVGCGGSQDEADLDVPASPEEAGSLVVRVSGTEGVAYSGDYGSLAGAVELVDDTVGAEPTDYEVDIQDGVSDGVIASFQKTEPGQGELRVQTLADDKVVVEGRTLAEFGTANADWLPQEAIPSEGIPPEDEMMFDDEMLPPEEEGPPEPVEVTSEG